MEGNAVTFWRNPGELLLVAFISESDMLFGYNYGVFMQVFLNNDVHITFRIYAGYCNEPSDNHFHKCDMNRVL